jgi:hypothetical protein
LKNWDSRLWVLCKDGLHSCRPANGSLYRHHVQGFVGAAASKNKKARSRYETVILREGWILNRWCIFKTGTYIALRNKMAANVFECSGVERKCTTRNMVFFVITIAVWEKLIWQIAMGWACRYDKKERITDWFSSRNL